MEWKDRIARLFRRTPDWEREHRRTLIVRHAENLLRERDINSVTDLVRRHRKSDLTIAGIRLTMNTATSRFLRTPEDAAGKDMLELMDALRRTSFAKKIGRRLADVPADTAHSLHGLLAMHTFLLDAYLEQHPDSKLRQPPMDEVQAAAHIVDRQFRAETFRELRHLAETRGRYMPSCYVVRLYDWDADMGRLQKMRGRLDGPACPEAPQQVQQLRKRIWKAENRMVREAERILESDPEISLRQTYIEKLDAELQTLGWLARFPERIDDSRINRQLLDKYRILPGISPAEQYGQVEKAFRELDARLVRMTGRQSYADDLFESLRQKGPKPEKHISGVRQKEINSARKEQTGQPASGRRIKR
ncbi:hypothetical protein [Alistipes finegoldii]|uniref:hypothetical protein n=2 Tax=Alistipes finegoldii TaxID=214856 RepID=UPI003A875CAB